MMGIEVAETFWAYHKCNKAFSDIFYTQMQWCTNKHTSCL